MSASRIRWGLAGSLALLGLGCAVTALVTYAAHGLVLGVLAVVALAAITIVGTASLALARRRIGGELAAMTAAEPGGQLFSDRKRRLEAIKATGARPDLRALADATAAAEASRAYLGRYLVATTVLVGLVGTFAGLMETLGKVAPLLSQDGGALSLLAAPLAGLHVTFGASLVAIVVTLALSLAQGDLVLHEEQALATLEDLTQHLLLPTLWPPTADANERTVRLLEGLGPELAQAVAAAVKEATTAMEQTQQERFRQLGDDLGKAARETSAAVALQSQDAAAALAKTAVQVESQVQSLTTALSDKLAESTQQQVLQVTQAVAHVAQRLGQGGEALLDGWRAQLVDTRKAVAAQAEDVIAQSALLAEQMSKQLDEMLAQAGARLDAAARESQALAQQANDRAERQAQWFAQHAAENAEKLAGVVERAHERGERQATALAEHAATTAAQAAAWVQKAHEQTQAQVDTLLGRVAALAQEATELVHKAHAESAAHAQAVTEHATHSAEDVQQSLQQATQAMLSETRAGVTAAAQALAETLRPLFSAQGEQNAQLTMALQSNLQRLDTWLAEVDQQTRARQEQTQRHAEAVATAVRETAEQVVRSLGETTMRNGEQLLGAADKLAQGARALESTLAPLQPRLDALTTELERLTHEVALMAAQSDASHESAVVLAELERVGDGLERLASLVRLAREPEAAELQEAHS